MIRFTDRKFNVVYANIQAALAKLKEVGYDTNPLLKAMDYLTTRAYREGMEEGKKSHATQEGKVKGSSKRKHQRTQ